MFHARTILKLKINLMQKSKSDAILQENKSDAILKLKI